MRSWRKTTWVMAMWTVFMAAWIVSGATADWAGQGTAFIADATIGVTVLFMVWLLVLAPLALVWSATRPTNNVNVYGSPGHQTMASEKEAVGRVATHGWTYQVLTKSDQPGDPTWG